MWGPFGSDSLHSEPDTTLHSFQRWRNHFWFIKCDLMWESAFSSKSFFFFLQLVTFCFLTPPFASVACHLPRSPENRMELHKSLTCFRWPYESCMSTLINTGRLLWPRNGYAPPGQGRAGRPAWTPPGPQSVKSFPNPISVSPPVSRTVNQGGELLVFGDVV